jgi:ABC-type branched-subunit amino acid transport system substrate-binding protein
MKLDTSKVIGWIADNTAAVESAAGLTNTLNTPIISPLASSAAFRDQEEYPNFFRTIQGDVTISVAISKLAKSFSYNYVNVIYSSDSFGKGGMETFEAVAAQEEICVLQKYMVSPSMNASQILKQISLSTSSVVVLWTNGADTTELLRAKSVNSGAYQNMVLIFSMPYMELAKSFGASAWQSFFLSIKTKDYSQYLKYLASFSTEALLSNSFLYEYYTTLFKCNLPGSNR